MTKYYPTIGLEIHAELKTKTKMFCACKNDPDEEKPNVNVCPVCLAHPGALPVPNKQAIENVIKVGLAIGGDIANFSEFDRKNYFYPDIPKGYQISQFEYPIVSHGRLADFDVTRIHLEEDTGNNKHFETASLIDFNRAGVPLMELVTEPHTFETADETAKKATRFAKELQLLLWYLDVSEANMEKGEMRVEANISISPDPKKLGTKVEVKNLNSFRSVEKAIKYEVDRMTALMEAGRGDEIVQETRGWNETKQETYSQRKKEGSADYRYFPDPDLPKMKLHEAFDLEVLKKSLPELPEAKRARYRKNFGINEKDIDVYINYVDYAKDFEKTIEEIEKEKVDRVLGIQTVNNQIISSVMGVLNEHRERHFPEPKEFAQVSASVIKGIISPTAGKSVLEELTLYRNKSAHEIIKEKGLYQNSNTEELKTIAQKIIDANAKVVADYKKGKENALMSLVGQIMKDTKGSANPQVAREVLINLLK